LRSIGGEGVLLRSSRKLVALLVALSVVAVGLALVGIGKAGSTQGGFSLFETPVNLTAGAQGLAFAKFTPTSALTGGNGSATHVVITISLPSDSTAVTVTSCPGTKNVTGTTATCSISSIQSGVTAKFFVTFNAGPNAGPGKVSATVTGGVTWDNGGGGAAGQGQGVTGTTQTYIIWPANTTTDVYAGTCANGAITTTQIATDPSGTGKGGNLSSTKGIDPTLGFPCTPGYVGIDVNNAGGFRNPTGATSGVWTAFIAPLQNGALAQAVLTLNDAPVPYQKMKLYEVFVGADPVQVLACNSDGTPQGTASSCLTNQTKFGNKGVAFYLNFKGSTIDPSWNG